MRQFSDAARDHLTWPWEEFVPYPYDDKQPKVHGRYPEYLFNHPPRGTITVATGHTDAAGPIRIAGLPEKITKGMRLTREQGEQLLSDDLAPCVAAINRMLRVAVTQHQFDALVDTHYNCPSAAVAAIKLINAGRSDQVPAKLLQYVCSKGERMEGLVHRRNAEIAWFNTPDKVEPPAEPNPDIVFSPKGERNPPPMPVRKSRTVMAGGSILAVGLSEAVKAFNELLAPIKEAKGSLDDLGVFDLMGAAAHDPKFIACMAVAGLAAFIIWDRRHKLLVDHV